MLIVIEREPKGGVNIHMFVVKHVKDDNDTRIMMMMNPEVNATLI